MTDTAMRRLAIAAAFVGHAPALAVLGYRLRRGAIIANVIAVAATLVAMAIAGARAGGLAVLVAWLAGHAAWGAALAAAVAIAPDRTFTARRAR